MSNLEKGVLFNYEWIEVCKGLTSEEFSKLFFAIADYQKNGTQLPEFTGTLKIISTLIFPCLKNRIESAEMGKQGALKRWNNAPNSPPNSKDKISKDKISKDKRYTREKEQRERLENQFNEFWRAYPKKQGKEYAQKCYMKQKPDAELHKIIIDAIERQKQGTQWQDIQYIPNPSTWLNRKQWEDEIESTENKYAKLNEHTDADEILKMIK